VAKRAKPPASGAGLPQGGSLKSTRAITIAIGALLTVATGGCGSDVAARPDLRPAAHFSRAYLAHHNVVLRGALVFRITDMPDPAPYVTYYEVVWHLNRDPCSSHRAELKRHSIPDNCGQFGIGSDTRLDLDNFAKLASEPSQTKPRGACVSSTIEGGPGAYLPDLDTYEIGQPIKASIRPVEPDPASGKLPKYGETFISRPRVMSGDYAHTGHAMVRALASIGCK
jgi:hypothetical protein